MIVTYKEGVTGSSPVAPTHKTPGQRPKPRLADETDGWVFGLGAPLGHQRLNFGVCYVLSRPSHGRGHWFESSIAHPDTFELMT
jgi:hypothetical protein